MKNKSAQAWSMDLIIASSIFMLGLGIFYFYSVNSLNEGQSTLDTLQYEGQNAADTILSQGYPASWTTSNVISPGIIDNNEINQTKLENLNSLANSNMDRLKKILVIKNKIFLNLSEPLYISGQITSGIGENPTNTQNIIKISRVTIYNKKPVSLYLYIWN